MVDVDQWCASRRLQLNADKTEAIWIASRASLNKVKSQDCSLVIGAETVTPVDVVRHLGVYLDSELFMKQHVAKVTSIYFFRLRQVRHHVGKDITICLVLAVIMSRLDYCNSVLADNRHSSHFKESSTLPHGSSATFHITNTSARAALASGSLKN